MTTHERIAALLDPAVGDHLGDVSFADLVDEVHYNLAERLAKVRAV